MAREFFVKAKPWRFQLFLTRRFCRLADLCWKLTGEMEGHKRCDWFSKPRPDGTKT